MQKRTLWLPLVATSLLLVAGCVSVPAGPTVLVLPGQQKSFDLFQYDDIACRQYAQSLVAPAGQEAVNNACLLYTSAGLPGSPTDVLPSSQGARRGDGEERRHQDIAVRIADHWPTSKVIASPAMIRAISVSSTRQAVAWLKIGASRRAP